MPQMDVRWAIMKAKQFVEWGPPNADLGTFYPTKAVYDGEEKIWIIECQFKKGGIDKHARLKIEDNTQNIVHYEEIKR